MNRRKAFDLRCAGETYRDIADALGVNVRTAFDYVDTYWAELEVTTKEKAEMLREMELQKLNKMERKWLPIATSNNLDVSSAKVTGTGEDAKVAHIEIPDYEAGTKAAAIVLKIQERRAKLLDLDMPEKVEHSGELKHAHFTRDEWKQRMKEARA